MPRIKFQVPVSSISHSLVSQAPKSIMDRWTKPNQYAPQLLWSWGHKNINLLSAELAQKVVKVNINLSLSLCQHSRSFSEIILQNHVRIHHFLIFLFFSATLSGPTGSLCSLYIKNDKCTQMVGESNASDQILLYILHKSLEFFFFFCFFFFFFVHVHIYNRHLSHNRNHNPVDVM